MRFILGLGGRRTTERYGTVRYAPAIIGDLSTASTDLQAHAPHDAHEAEGKTATIDTTWHQLKGNLQQPTTTVTGGTFFSATSS